MQIIISFGVNYNLDIVTRFIHNVLNNGDKKKKMRGEGFLLNYTKHIFVIKSTQMVTKQNQFHSSLRKKHFQQSSRYSNRHRGNTETLTHPEAIERQTVRSV